MNVDFTWHSLCFALAVNKAAIGQGGIYYMGNVYRQTPDRKGLEHWDSRKATWVKVKL